MKKTLHEELHEAKPKKDFSKFKNSVSELIDVLIALCLIDGGIALWSRPLVNTMFGHFYVHRVAAAALWALVVYMFLSGKRYRNR